MDLYSSIIKVNEDKIHYKLKAIETARLLSTKLDDQLSRELRIKPIVLCGRPGN